METVHVIAGHMKSDATESRRASLFDWADIIGRIGLALLSATLIFHAYWSVPADQVMNQQNEFAKNLAIVGGLLLVLAHGSGRYALDKS